VARKRSSFLPTPLNFESARFVFFVYVRFFHTKTKSEVSGSIASDAELENGLGLKKYDSHSSLNISVHGRSLLW